MTKLLLAACAALALTACNSNKVADDSAANTAAANAAAAAAAVDAKAVANMPPPIKASKTYRCKDQSLVYVSFLEGGTQAQLHDGEKTAPLVALTAPAAGQPFVAEGFSVSGANQTAMIARPGKPAQSCKANS